MGAAARSNLLIMYCISTGPGAGMEHRGMPGLGFCSYHGAFFYFIDLGSSIQSYKGRNPLAFLS